MEILERLLTLIVDKVPVVAAETMFAILGFGFRPYRAAIRLVAFARRNKLPTQLFVALSLTLFMPVGFSKPFSGFDVKTVSQVSTLNNKIDLSYVTIYVLGLTSLVVLMHLFIDMISAIRYRRVFRDLFFVSVALVIPWSALIFFSLIRPAIYDWHVLDSVWTGASFWILVFAIATAPTLIFAVQSDLRWHRSSPRYRRAIRIAQIYASTVVILALTPLYFVYLNTALYPEELDFTAQCFDANDALYAAVSVENRTQKTVVLGQFLSRPPRSLRPGLPLM